MIGAATNRKVHKTGSSALRRTSLGTGLISAGLIALHFAAVVSSAAAGSDSPGDQGVWKDEKTAVEFVRVPGGEYEMGSPLRDNEKPVHRVRVNEFWLARSEVTQAQWLRVMGNKPSSHKGCDDCPVERVSWMDVQKYLQRTGYRLPTEAEWEYAAGGGAEHQRWAGTNDPSELGIYAWSRANSKRQSNPVCARRTNLFGLCDMTGKVYEWCADWYDAGYYRI